MKYSTLILGTIWLISGCNDVSGTSELPPNEELILGSWQVSAASIDGQAYPVTNPGFGQMQAIIDEQTIAYIYPKVNELGLPTAKNDTLIATWNFNDDQTVFTITHPQTGETLLVWDIMTLGVGLLKTSYEAQSATNTEASSNYEITYRLTE